ncbi:MAG: FAD-dependent oxidoreductase, partial [Bacillota bacterium]
MKKYDIIIVGAGASGVFMSYELTKLPNKAKVLMIDKGAGLEKRVCPIKTGKVHTCIRCVPCHIMNGYGGAGTLSDGKYNITTQFGGDLHNYVGTEQALELMEYVDQVLCSMGGADAKLYSTGNSELKTLALRNNLHLLDAKVRHLGTDRNVRILEKIFEYTKDRIETEFYTQVMDVEKTEEGFRIMTDKNEVYECNDLVLAT